MDTKGYHIILGSGSPRRKELLGELGFEFEVDTRNTFEEVYSENTPQERIPEVLSEGKSLGFHRNLTENEILITSDTLVLCEGRVMGKPRDREDAVDMSIGFRTKLDIDYPQYRIKLDLERQPTMETLSFRNGSRQETVTLSPVSIRIDGSDSVIEWSEVSNVVIHFRDGSSYVVKDDESCVYGWAATSGYRVYDNGRLISYLFSNIIDIHQVQYIQVDGYNYVLTNP